MCDVVNQCSICHSQLETSCINFVQIPILRKKGKKEPKSEDLCKAVARFSLFCSVLDPGSDEIQQSVSNAKQTISKRPKTSFVNIMLKVALHCVSRIWKRQFI